MRFYLGNGQVTNPTVRSYIAQRLMHEECTICLRHLLLDLKALKLPRQLMEQFNAVLDQSRGLNK